MVNFALVVHKIMEMKGLSNEKDVAKALNISPQDFSNRKKRGTLLPVIVEWAIHEKVNLDWLLTGEDSLTAPPLEHARQDVVKEKIGQLLDQMDEDKKRDVLKYVEEKKLLMDLLTERQSKKTG